jgi:hypothetical protein
MPIRVNCQCGQVLNVPDAMAGKAGKCPKCSAVVRIPAGNSGKSPTSQPQPAKKPAPQAQDKPSSKNPASVALPRTRPLDDLFEEAGIVPKSGNYCPKCDTSIPAGAAICVKCGLNFATGEVLTEHQVAAPAESYGNIHLDEAVVMMRRDADTEKRSLNAGNPWWVLLCFLLGGCILVAAGVLLVDARVNGPQASGTIIGDLQREPIGVLIMKVGLAVGCLIFVFGWLNMTFLGFQEKLKWGLINLFIPPAIVVFGLMRYRKFKGTVKAILMSVVLMIATGIGLLVSG